MEDRQLPDSQVWFTRRGGAVAGPFPCGMVRRFVLLGRLTEDSDVSPDGEQWYRLGDIERLVPEEMRHLESAEDYRRLELARRREDERRIDRREQTGAAETDERRTGSERREPEDEDALSRRYLRERNLASPAVPAGRLPYLLGGVVVTALVLGAAYVWMSRPDEADPTRNCAAAAAPGVDWSNCSLEGLRLPGAELQGARIENADLHGARLQGAQLGGARLAYSNLGAADLRFADLRGAVLLGTGLRGADLGDARLERADLSYADLRGARIDGARLTEAKLGKAIWVDGRVCAPESVGRCN